MLNKLINESEGFVDLFCESIVDVFAHDEIVEALDKIDNNKLLLLKSNLFSKLQHIFTVLTNRELFA